MKKTIFLAVLITSFMVASCTIFLPQLRLTGVAVIGQSERKTNLVTISVWPAWDNPGKGNKKIRGFYVEFRNMTNSPVSIVWEKSLLKYGNGAFAPFVEGQRYEDSSRPMDSLIIPPNGMARKYIYSSQQVFREAGKSGKWKLRPIEADVVVLEFYVQSRDIVDHYTIEVR